MPARRGRNELQGHAFAGWVTARELSAEDLDLIEVIEERRPGLDWTTQKALDKRQAAVEGDILPTSECGWKGLAEDWQELDPGDHDKLVSSAARVIDKLCTVKRSLNAGIEAATKLERQQLSD